MQLEWKSIAAWASTALLVLSAAMAGAPVDGSIDWGREGLVTARGMGRAGPRTAPGGEHAAACRAAEVDAQRRLLEIVQGATLFGGVTAGDAMSGNDVVRSTVSGVLRGARLLEGSMSWDASSGTCELMMVVPVDNIRRSLPRLRLAADGRTVLVAEQEGPRDPMPREPARQTLDAAPDRFHVLRGDAVTLDVLGNDDGDPSTFGVEVTSGVRHGSLFSGPHGTFKYHHGGGGEATDGFRYELVTARGERRGADVTIVIDAPAPVEPMEAPTRADGEEEPQEDSVAESAEADPLTETAAPAAEPSADVHGDVTNTDAMTRPVDPPAPATPADLGVETQDVATESAPPAAPILPAETLRDVGGPAEPVPSRLPDAIVLDAGDLPVQADSFFRDIKSISGETIYALAPVPYESALDGTAGSNVQVLTVIEVEDNLIDVVLAGGEADLLRSLLAQRDYAASGDLYVIGRD